MTRLLTIALALLTGLFVFRVTAQALQQWWPIEYLPPFEAWQGSSLSYPLLLSAQLLIATTMVCCVFRVALNKPITVPRMATYLSYFSWVYLSASLLRFCLGYFELIDHRWFAQLIPAAFHLVLATFILLLTTHIKNSPAQNSSVFTHG